MNKYTKRIESMINHLSENPHDYQSVISLLKANSNSIVCENKKKNDMKQKEIAKYRRK